MKFKPNYDRLIFADKNEIEPPWYVQVLLGLLMAAAVVALCFLPVLFGK
jgi:hypothetical protein